MADPPRPGRLLAAASWGTEAASTIASNPTALRASLAYWRARFDELKETPFTSSDSPAIKFSGLLEDLALERARASDFHLAQQIDRTGCLLSSREVASHLLTLVPAATRAATSGDTVLNFLRDFDRAARSTAPTAGSADANNVARGILAARELFDVARRFHFCSPPESAAGLLTRAEALALFRQEGSFALTPPRDSLDHGPVILTGRGCRTPAVTADPHNVHRAERPGFCVVFRAPEHTSDTDVGRSLETVNRNLLFIGGLDTVVNPKEPKGDELVHVFANFVDAIRVHALAGVPSDADQRSIARAVGPLNERQKVSLLRLMLGLAMVELDGNETVPSLSALLSQSWSDASRLLAAHPVAQVARDLHLLNGSKLGAADPTDDDVHSCLRVQQRWYLSRKNPTTLLGHVDRHPVDPPLLPFPPFVAYVRFNAGDAVFVGILLRCLLAFDKLRSNRSVSSEFREELTRVQDGWSSAHRSEWRRELRALVEHEKFWKKNVKSTASEETAWRHIGLVRKLRGAGAAPWLTDPPSTPILARASAAAVQVMATLHGFQLMEAMNRLLENTRVTVLFRLVNGLPADWMKIFAKAHTFEALRRAYLRAQPD